MDYNVKTIIVNYTALGISIIDVKEILQIIVLLLSTILSILVAYKNLRDRND